MSEKNANTIEFDGEFADYSESDPARAERIAQSMARALNAGRRSLGMEVAEGHDYVQSLQSFLPL